MRIEYDVVRPEFQKQELEDLQAFKEFVIDRKHQTMAITYKSNYEAKKRRLCFRAWFDNNKDLLRHKDVIKMPIMDTKLYVENITLINERN